MLLVFPKSQSGLGGGCKTNSESFPGTCLQCSHSLQTCSLPLLRISLAFIIAKGLPCSVVQLCGCGGLWALFSMTFHNPNPSIITLRPHCWNVPHVSCLASLPADHNDNASWLLSLMLLLWGGICYVSCNLTHLQLGFKSGFKRLVAISWLWSSWRPTWGDAYPELRAANGLWGSCSALLCSSPSCALHDVGMAPADLRLHPTQPRPAAPRSTLLDSAYIPSFWDGMTGRKAEGFQLGREGTWLVCLFVSEENTARDYVPFIGDYWGRGVQ